MRGWSRFFFFFFNDTATTEIYTLSLHDALPIYTEDSQTIPRIFTLETQLASKASLIEQPFKPQLTSPNHEAMQEIDWKGVPPLGGYVATTLKSTAELVLMSHQEDPVLATWRYGLGRSAAVTSDAKAKWGVLWLRWRDFNKFL